MKLTKQAIKLIEKMVGHVLAHPETLDQESFPTACDTPYCAAGHLITLKSKKKFKTLLKTHKREDSMVFWSQEALDAIGVTLMDLNFYTGNLFGNSWGWPYAYYIMYREAERRKTKKAQERGKTEAFAARWRAFIAENS